MSTPTPKEALLKVVELAGGQSALARELSTEARPIRQGHVWAWINRDGLLPPEFCRPAEALTGVSRYALRPDVFGPPPSDQGREAA